MTFFCITLKTYIEIECIIGFLCTYKLVEMVALYYTNQINNNLYQLVLPNFINFLITFLYSTISLLNLS